VIDDLRIYTVILETIIRFLMTSSYLLQGEDYTPGLSEKSGTTIISGSREEGPIFSKGQEVSEGSAES
jgi:hypothetical protein